MSNEFPRQPHTFMFAIDDEILIATKGAMAVPAEILMRSLANATLKHSTDSPEGRFFEAKVTIWIGADVDLGVIAVPGEVPDGS